MEDNARPFEAVRIGMTSVETGTERFTTDGRIDRMQVASWRVNLTALSQRYNLYFIAAAHRVLVYEPEFPFQKLGRKPQLTITPQLANPQANGFIQPQRPHCINHLMVGNLGHQEILLFSTDSGNVIAYHTSAILNAIRKEPTKFSESAQAEYVGLRPFFSQWVFESAWGLAIHSEARMIAVSANTPYHIDSDDRASKITVFAFALCANNSDETVDGNQSDSDTDSTSRHLDWTPWVPTPNSGNVSSDPSARDRNYKIVLAGVDGHTNNIPCITFINGSQDPEGSWLLSTDIHGEIKLWRIWKGRCLRTWNFSDRGSIGAAWLRRYEAGWLVAALDIKSFRPAETNDTFVGHRRAPQYYGYDAAGASYDLTNVVRQHVPSNSIYHPVNSDIDDGDSLSEPDALYEDMSDSEVTADEEETARAQRIVAELSATPSMFSRPAELGGRAATASTMSNLPNFFGPISVRTSRAMADGDFASEDEDSDVYVEESDEEDGIQVEIESDFSDDEMSDIDGHGGSTASPPSTTSLSSYKDRHSNDSPGSSNKSQRGSKRSSPTGPVAADGSQCNKIEIPDVPFIHCSTSHLRMFSGTETRSPHIFCARILKQILAPEMEGMQVVQMDRLSMIEQIPELGIVVIASQVGRCAICTLTRRRSDGLPGLRVDWVLPTKKEERAGLRPVEHPLLGIATGPVQGRFMKESMSHPENDSPEHWAKDRIIDGTPTSFDDKVVDMDAQDGTSSESSGDDNIDRIFLTSRQHGKEISGSSRASRVPLRSHRWPNSKGNEDWMAMESSRRYRLMMTYGDSTVLTYELSRGVEKEDQDTHVQAR